MSDSQYKSKIAPDGSLWVNPYKYEKKEDEWEKICKKYGEEDKSKLKKEKRNE